MEETLTRALEAIWDALAEKEILRVEVCYFGNDGDGEIESTKYTGPMVYDDDTDRKLEDLLYKILDRKCPYWNDEDGSDGTITLFIPERLLVIDHDQLYKTVKKFKVHIRV